MTHPTLTRLFEDGTWRLSRAGAWSLVGAFVIGAAIVCAARAYDWYHPFIANDFNTVYFAHFARDLLRYPLAATHGLMANLVGDSPAPSIAGNAVTFYPDHPSGLIWLIGLANRLFVGDPVVAARLVSIAASLGIGATLIAFVCRRVAPLPAIGTIFVLLTLNLYWEHAVVGQFEPVVTLFMLGAAVAFLAYLRQPTARRLAAAALLWTAGMLCDWPAYLLGGPIAAALLYRRWWGTLVFFTALGVATMAAVYAHLVLGGTGVSPVASFSSTFGDTINKTPYLATLPAIFRLAVRAFWWWTLFLLLPFVGLFRRAVDTDTRELRFVFLAFLFAGVGHDLLFNQWAREHSFWNYYLIPAVCIGAAIALQCLHEIPIRSGRTALAFRTVVVALFIVGAVSSARHMVFFLRSHFYPVKPLAALLDEQGVKDLLDRDSMILVAPYCREPQRLPDAARAADCEIYSIESSLARFAVDRPAFATSDFDATKANCGKTFVVVKSPETMRKLAQLGVTPVAVTWFRWNVLRLSQLGPPYCSNPSRIFADVHRQP
jgi:hypothetical protein